MHHSGVYRAVAAPGILFNHIECGDDRGRGSTYCVTNRGRARFTLTNVVFSGPVGETEVTNVTFNAEVINGIPAINYFDSTDEYLKFVREVNPT